MTTGTRRRVGCDMDETPSLPLCSTGSPDHHGSGTDQQRINNGSATQKQISNGSSSTDQERMNGSATQKWISNGSATGKQRIRGSGASAALESNRSWAASDDPWMSCAVASSSRPPRPPSSSDSSDILGHAFPPWTSGIPCAMAHHAS